MFINKFVNQSNPNTNLNTRNEANIQTILAILNDIDAKEYENPHYNHKTLIKLWKSFNQILNLLATLKEDPYQDNYDDAYHCVYNHIKNIHPENIFTAIMINNNNKLVNKNIFLPMLLELIPSYMNYPVVIGLFIDQSTKIFGTSLIFEIALAIADIPNIPIPDWLYESDKFYRLSCQQKTQIIKQQMKANHYATLNFLQSSDIIEQIDILEICSICYQIIPEENRSLIFTCIIDPLFEKNKIVTAAKIIATYPLITDEINLDFTKQLISTLLASNKYLISIEELKIILAKTDIPSHFVLDSTTENFEFNLNNIQESMCNLPYTQPQFMQLCIIIMIVLKYCIYIITLNKTNKTIELNSNLINFTTNIVSNPNLDLRTIENINYCKKYIRNRIIKHYNLNEKIQELGLDQSDFAIFYNTNSNNIGKILLVDNNAYTNAVLENIEQTDKWETITALDIINNQATFVTNSENNQFIETQLEIYYPSIYRMRKIHKNIFNEQQKLELIMSLCGFKELSNRIQEKIMYILTHRDTYAPNKFNASDETEIGICVTKYLQPYIWCLDINSIYDILRRTIYLTSQYITFFEKKCKISELNNIEKGWYYLMFFTKIMYLISSHGGGTEHGSSDELRHFAIGIFNHICSLDPDCKIIPNQYRSETNENTKKNNLLYRLTSSPTNINDNQGAFACASIIAKTCATIIRENKSELWNDSVYGVPHCWRNI